MGISVEDEAKLADFGLAMYVGAEVYKALPVAGTAAFLAPELVLGADEDSDDEEYADYAAPRRSISAELVNERAKGVDAFKTDAYSFGVTLQVLLLGERGGD